MRSDIVRMIAEAGSGHPGGSLSRRHPCGAVISAECSIMIPSDPIGRARPLHPGEGPCGAGFVRRARPGGLLPREELLTLRKLGTRLQGPSRLEPRAGRRGVHGPARPGFVRRGGGPRPASLGRRPQTVFALLGDDGGPGRPGMGGRHVRGTGNLDNPVAVVDPQRARRSTARAMWRSGRSRSEVPGVRLGRGGVDGHDLAALRGGARCGEGRSRGQAACGHRAHGEGQGRRSWRTRRVGTARPERRADGDEALAALEGGERRGVDPWLSWRTKSSPR